MIMVVPAPRRRPAERIALAGAQPGRLGASSLLGAGSIFMVTAAAAAARSRCVIGAGQLKARPEPGLSLIWRPAMMGRQRRRKSWSWKGAKKLDEPRGSPCACSHYIRARFVYLYIEDLYIYI